MKKIFKVLISSLLCLPLILGCVFVQAKSLEKIVAIVNDDVITQSEFDQALLDTQKQIAEAHIDSKLSNAQLKQRVLNGLILEKLQLQMAKRADLTVSDGDVNRALSNIAKSNNLTTQQLEMAVEKMGTSFKVYKGQIRKQVLLARLQQEVIGPTVTVTPTDIEKFKREYASQQKDAINYKLETIVIPFMPTSKMSMNDQLAKAKALRIALQKKTSLNVAAKMVYGKKIATELGLHNASLGSNSKADLPNLFQNTVSTMSVGGYAGPIKAPNGFHILHLLGKENKNKPLTSEQINQLVFQQKFNEALQKWLKDLRASAYVKIMNGTA